MKQSLRRVWPYLVLVGAWALFFWRFAAPNPSDRITYPAGDFSQQFGVFRDVVYRSVAAGRLPLWADCLFSGYPIHADPQAQLFYPPLWLVFGFLRLQGWAHFPIGALVAEVAAHYLFLSLTLYLFLSSLGLRRPAAVLGTLIFTYGGYLTSYPPLQTAVLEVNGWLPLSLLFAGQLAQTRRLRALALTAGALALGFLAGHPQTFVYMALLVLAYFAFRVSQAGHGWRYFAGASAGWLGLTTALVAVQLLPSLQFIFNSTRLSVDLAQAGHGFAFGEILQLVLTGFVSYWHPLYAGLLTLALAAVALTRPRPEIRFWTGALLLTLILSFGAKAIIYDLGYWAVPGLSLFREQERWAFAVSLSLAILAAFGAHIVLGPLSRPARQSLERLVRITGWSLLGGLGLLAVVTYLARLGFDPSDWGRLPERTGVMVFALALAWLALLVRARQPDLRRWTPALFIGVVVLDLFATNRPVNVVPVFDPFPPDPRVLPLLGETSFFRVQDDVQLPGHAGCAYGFRAVDGVTPYRVRRYAEFMERVPEAARWQLLGVRYVVTWRAEIGGPFPAEVTAQGSGRDANGNLSNTFRLDWEPRRAWLAHNVSWGSRQHWAETELANPFDHVRLERPADAEAPAALSGPASSPIEVRTAADEPGRIRLTTDSAAPGALVLSEPYFPGWQASVDGAIVPVYPAEGALMAVLLPAGPHQVEFAYTPGLLRWGALISVAALLAALALGMSRR